MNDSATVTDLIVGTEHVHTEADDLPLQDAWADPLIDGEGVAAPEVTS